MRRHPRNGGDPGGDARLPFSDNHAHRTVEPSPGMSPCTTSVDIGVDIGGTFTDIVCRRAGEPMRTLKIPTTRGDPSQAVLNAITHLSNDLNVAATDIARFLVNGDVIFDLRQGSTILSTEEIFSYLAPACTRSGSC